MADYKTSDLSISWKQWFSENGPRLLLFARGQTRGIADAEDVLQDAILRLWKTYATGEDSEPPPLPLAYTAIRHAAIDYARRNTRRTKREQKSEYVVAVDEPAIDWFGTSSLEDKERAAAVQEAIAKLPDKFREVLTLKIWGDQTFAQIAETLDIPLNTAASRYRYALEALRKTLRPNSL
jgi:RNA polymerase sigma-70 factor (ECF subfamily)